MASSSRRAVENSGAMLTSVRAGSNCDASLFASCSNKASLAVNKGNCNPYAPSIHR